MSGSIRSFGGKLWKTVMIMGEYVILHTSRAINNGVFNMSYGLRPKESEGASHVNILQKKEYFRPGLVAMYLFH